MFELYNFNIEQRRVSEHYHILRSSFKKENMIASRFPLRPLHYSSEPMSLGTASNIRLWPTGHTLTSTSFYNTPIQVLRADVIVHWCVESVIHRLPKQLANYCAPSIEEFEWWNGQTKVMLCRASAVTVCLSQVMFVNQEHHSGAFSFPIMVTRVAVLSGLAQDEPDLFSFSPLETIAIMAGLMNATTATSEHCGHAHLSWDRQK